MSVEPSDAADSRYHRAMWFAKGREPLIVVVPPSPQTSAPWVVSASVTMRHTLLLLLVMASCPVAAAAQGGVRNPQLEYRIPAGFVYKEVALSPKDARDLARRHAVLTLLNVTEVSADVAGALVTPYLDTFLTFPALETIDVNAAAKLSVRRGYLRLWGLTSLTPEVAAALVASPGQRLEVIGVRHISPEVARALVAGKREKLGLGLTALSADIAEILAEFPGAIWFPHLETLSPEAAAAMSSHRGSLDLGPARISPEVAEELLRHDAPIGLTSVKRLAPGVGDILARHKSEVRLELDEIDSAPLAAKLFREPNRSSSVDSLRTMSAEIARELVRSPSHPSFQRLDSLTPEAARELAKKPGDIKLWTLATITAETARALTDRPKDEAPVRFDGIVALDGPEAVAVAKALAETSGRVSLTRLNRVSAEALAVLRTKSAITLPTDEQLTIVP